MFMCIVSMSYIYIHIYMCNIYIRLCHKLHRVMYGLLDMVFMAIRNVCLNS